MLIDSHRLSKEDRRLWAEYYESDLINAGSIERYAESAGRVIIDFVSRKRCYAGVSWGKDSVVVAHLMLRFAPHVPLVHLRPTNHNPDCDRVRDAYFAAYPSQEYWEIVVDYSHIDRSRLSPPQIDKATDKEWYAAFDSLKPEFDSYVIGIRSSESGGRSIRLKNLGLESNVSLLPIGWWSTSEVFAYLASNDLPIHPAYAMLGGGRWARDKLRVSEIGDTGGSERGRSEWEQEYYGDVLSRILSK
jgi:phosphoadenosine phosphosulfate reductase